MSMKTNLETHTIYTRIHSKQEPEQGFTITLKNTILCGEIEMRLVWISWSSSDLKKEQRGKVSICFLGDSLEQGSFLAKVTINLYHQNFLVN